MTSVQGPIRSSMWCGSIAPIATPPITRSRSGPGLMTRPRTPSSTIPSVGLDSIGRYGRTPRSGMPWMARPRSSVRASPGWWSRCTLFTMAPATRTPCAAKCEALSTISSIGRPTPPSRHDHRRRPEHRGDGGVGHPDNRAHARVPGALDQEDVVLGELAVGIADQRAQVLHDLARDVGLGEAARDVDGAHRARRLGQAEDHPHQQGILVEERPVHEAIVVGGVRADRDRALSDGLHEPRVVATPPEAVDEPQGGRGLAAVLAGGGEVEVPHRRGWWEGRTRQPREAVLRSMSWTASRRRTRDSSSTLSGSR